MREGILPVRAPYGKRCCIRAGPDIGMAHIGRGWPRSAVTEAVTKAPLVLSDRFGTRRGIVKCHAHWEGGVVQVRDNVEARDGKTFHFDVLGSGL